ncbi:HFL225Wp [Eremothecium sinecaudum]|uniref:HFL225Wp n=1 Tax=Eremothecium sinecaudum TaxID=45286 RepID=A0A120K2I0_9SACH|nr:HFL225Wp [Eremothecium sinecaudum]AMD21631.1 HFL225Wp [Eremothecium sinecaudum]
MTTSNSSSHNSDTAVSGNKNQHNLKSPPHQGDVVDSGDIAVDEDADTRPMSSWRLWYGNRRPSLTTATFRTQSTKPEKPDQETSDYNGNACDSPVKGASPWWRVGGFPSFKSPGRKSPEGSNRTAGEYVDEAGSQLLRTAGSIPEELQNGTNDETAKDPTCEVLKDAPKEAVATKSKKKTWPLWNKGSAATVDENNTELNSVKLKKPVTNEVIVTANDAILFKTDEPKESPSEGSAQLQSENSDHNGHILVPSFDILPNYTALSYLYISIGTIGHMLRLIGESRFKHQSLYRRSAEKAINVLSDNKTRPVKVLLVGVHGFFPTKMIRPIIGEPTGTSTKFITEAEKTVIRWFKNQGTPVEVSKIALEKEGKIFDRVDFFFEVMKKWSNELNEADFVYFIAHSQGCPVTIMLLARLIDAGVIHLKTPYTNPDAPLDFVDATKDKVISLLCMAGINNGPFHGVDQTFLLKAYATIESDSLQELFQFQDFNALQSKKYIQALRLIVANNVKITFIGSINDQLVPLYSSTCLFAHHPNIFKATFIDKDSKTPAFITRIVKIAYHLINLGYDDHNIIKEISASLAGSLTCGGHSKVYYEDQVYELGIKFALQTTNLPADVPLIYKPYQVNQLGSNPYHLPWCMRGLLYETSVHLDKEETIELFREFDEWEPETKQLKDVKFRLNGLKSKL